MMKISSEINTSAKLVGEERAIELMAKAGFDAWDFSMFQMAPYDGRTRCLVKSDHPLAGRDYLAFAKRLKQIGLDNGIVCNQSHAPFPSDCKGMMPYLKRAIECTAEAGGKICVIHPANNASPEENAEMFQSLLPFAKECGIKIATENMWNWDYEKDEALPAACSNPKSFNAHLDAVADPYLVACLDIGHTEMRGLNTSAEEMILALGNRLAALHLHDNDLHKDFHALPFSMDIDFNRVVSALKQIDYRGYLTLETKQHLRQYTAETAAEGIQKMAQAAKQLAMMFES